MQGKARMTPKNQYRQDWWAYTEAGHEARNQGHHTQAEAHYLTALHLAESCIPPDDLLLLSLDNLADLYTALRRYADAASLLQRVLAQREAETGPQHLRLTACLNKLAELEVKQAHYPGAERLYRRHLAILQNSLRPDHPRITSCLNDLTDVLTQQGYYEEIEMLLSAQPPTLDLTPPAPLRP